MSRVYYVNSGSEANEKVFKMVRPDRPQAPRRQGSTRSSTANATTTVRPSAAMSAGGQYERNAQYGPFAPGFVEVPHCLEYRAQWDVEK